MLAQPPLSHTVTWLFCTPGPPMIESWSGDEVVTEGGKLLYPGKQVAVQGSPS